MKHHAGRLVGATGASALAGGATVTGGLFLMLLVDGLMFDSGGGFWRDLSPQLLILIVYGVVAAFIYFVGVLVIGLPAFLMLNHAGWTTRLHAVVAGAALSALVAPLFTKGDPSLMRLVGLTALGGAVAGLTFRKVAWRPG